MAYFFISERTFFIVRLNIVLLFPPALKLEPSEELEVLLLVKLAPR